MESKIEERITTAVERENYARHKLRQELVEKAEKGDEAGIKETLTMMADEVDKTDSKPRVTAEARDAETGMTLVAIATKQDNESLCRFLLTYWKQCDIDSGASMFLKPGELSAEAKTFRTNPNSRDMKGWSCVCIAVFHDARRCLRLLLEHGGDPNLKSSYNKNAWDLAKDELDAAEKVVKSKADIREILIEYDTTNDNKIFKDGGVRRVAAGDMYKVSTQIILI